MARETILGGIIDFFERMGIYDVVLPFLLVFSIMFAILEKTRVFGTERVGKEEYSRKNINAMVSFVTAFLVIASSKLVEAITQISSRMIILLLLIVFFLMMVGTFYTKEEIEKKGVALEGKWRNFFMVLFFISIVLIFLDSLKSGERTWLKVFTDWLNQFWTSTAVASIILIIVLIFFMFYITKEEAKT